MSKAVTDEAFWRNYQISEEVSVGCPRERFLAINSGLDLWLRRWLKIRSKTPTREWQMRMAGAPHHTNPRSATLDFWRKTTPYDQYKIIQAKRRKQMNMPTSSGLNKEDHLVIAHRLGEMEKRRVGTRFMDREVTEEDQAKPLIEGNGFYFRGQLKG